MSLKTSLVYSCILFLILSPTILSHASSPIKIGIVLPLTGSQANFGEIEKMSFEMALEEINAMGGINGRPLQLIIEDDTGRPDVGRSVVEKLINKDQVVMIGGGYSSSVTYAVAAVCQRNQIPFLVNTGSADNITSSGWDYVFRLNPPVSEYANAIETLLPDIIKPKTVVILYENSLFGTKGSKAFKTICNNHGYKILLNEGYEHGGIDFKPVLIRVKQLNPDIIYMISYVMDASLLMQQARELRIQPKMFIGGAAGFTLPEFVQNSGKASEKVISATLWHEILPYPGAKIYYDNFFKRYNKQTDYHGAEAYAACYVMADVLKRTASLKHSDIKEALLQTDMMTVFGPVKFINYGKMINQNRLPTYVVQWINGKLELVWPCELSTRTLVYPVDWLKEWLE